MKRTIVAASMAWVWLLAAGVGVAHGQTTAPTTSTETTVQLMKDVTFTLGVKLWVNEWQTGTIVSSPSTGTNNQAVTAWSVGVIPNVSLNFRDFFVSASYMWTPKYDFGDFTDFESGSGIVTRELEADRQEADVTFGYYIHPRVALAVGYKGIFQDYGHSETRYNGAVLGVLLNAPIGGGFHIFGNVFGGYMWVDCSPRCPEFDYGTYVNLEAGVAYRLDSIPLSVTASYRAQILRTEWDNPQFNAGVLTDITHGLVLGLNYSF